MLSNLIKFNPLIAYMGTLVSFLIIFGVLLLFCFLFFYAAIQDAKKKDKQQLKLLQELPEHVELKAIVKFNIGRPQGRFLKEKKFQGSGLLYTLNQQIFFKDAFEMEDKIFNPSEIVIKWHDEAEENVENSFSLDDGQEKIYFHIDNSKFLFSNANNLTSTYELFRDLKEYQSVNN